ncbi:MAG: hypothetical protein P8M70_14995, partial [Verrucomicrobiota bacterium]|nr:hypothetical protein [Verrucomicrobiota bacterium]
MRIAITLGLACFVVSGCKPKTEPETQLKAESLIDKKSAADRELAHLGKMVLESFITGKIDHLQPYTLWGVPEPKLFAGMKQVYVVDARITSARIRTITTTNRTAAHTNELKKLEAFLGNPTVEFEHMKAPLRMEMSALRQQHESVFRTHSGDRNPVWGKAAASIVVRPGTYLATPLPEGAVDILFSTGNRSYQLKLNNCVKLPDHGWVLGADLEFVDLAAQAAAEQEWSDDFPASQVRAAKETKQLLVN